MTREELITMVINITLAEKPDMDPEAVRKEAEEACELDLIEYVEMQM